MPVPTIWLVGEHNPYSADPRYALYPAPFRSAGDVLRRVILGMRTTDYVGAFRRRNLVEPGGRRIIVWPRRQARESAREMLKSVGHRDVLVLLGARVSEAFAPIAGIMPTWCPGRAFGLDEVAGTWATAIVLPHPSGRNRAWNEPVAVARARSILCAAAPSLAPLLGRIER